MGFFELHQFCRLGSGYRRDDGVKFCEQSLGYAQSDAPVQTGSTNYPKGSVWMTRPGCSGDDNHRSGHF